MTWNAVPVAILAGITGYSAVLFCGLYFALAKAATERARREYLTFALTCLAVVFYDGTCAGLYDAGSTERAFLWSRINIVAASFVGITYSVFVWDFLKRPVPWAFRCSAVVSAVLGLTVGLWESEYTLTLARPHVRTFSVLQREITYHEVEFGVLAQLLLLIFWITTVSLVVCVLLYLRSSAGRDERGRRSFLVATVITLVTMTTDILTVVGVTETIYTFEYGIAALYIAMGYLLLMRFGALHEAVNVLNRDLSATNADLAVALEQARESVRVKTEFLASISHELRTPLNAIINLPEQLIEQFVPLALVQCASCGAEFELDDTERLDADVVCSDCGATSLRPLTRIVFHGDGDKAQMHLRTVVRAAHHELRLVNDLLDASKLELGRGVLHPGAFEPAELVAEIVESVHGIATKAGVTVQFQQARDTDARWSVVADRGRIGQVLYNLLSNAIKFSHAGGVVEVSLTAPSGMEWELHVRDHGIGIDDKHQVMIFDKFRQVDGGTTRAYGGTGLGLAITKGLVELHGGRIWVESTLGAGATFSVRLPCNPSVLSAPSERVKPAA
ncbi:MAG: HAMP domain-containing sensor histidine kinase [Polyangiales bacterium]